MWIETQAVFGECYEKENAKRFSFSTDNVISINEINDGITSCVKFVSGLEIEVLISYEELNGIMIKNIKSEKK